MYKMKKQIRTISSFIAIISLLIVLTGCPSYEEEYQGPSGPAPATIHALLDGSPWATSSRSATVENGKITIMGSVSKGQTLKMVVFSDSIGNFPVGQGSSNYATYAFGSNTFSSINDKTTGEIDVLSISEADSLISGTFYYKLYNSNDQSVTFMNGYFTNLKYNISKSSKK
jgi:hypothetical protein